jgi:hypothetical protein
MSELKEEFEKIERIDSFIKKIDDKNFSIYFFTLDTRGNPTAGVANIYEHVKLLNELGYKAYILHEKNNYKLRSDEDGMGIEEWLGSEYAELPHKSIEKQDLNIDASDFVVVPEIFYNVMDQIKNFPCKKVVLCQSYDYLLELLPLGKRWNVDAGFNDVITTTERQSEYVKMLFPSIQTHIVPVSIPSYFKAPSKPKKPIISIVTRTQGDAAKIAKSFYLQYPMYKWVTFKELRGLTRQRFASDLSESALAVWIDDAAGFGTFPLEAMECGTPVIGKIPNMIPEWMETIDENNEAVIKNNGIWTNTTINIPELIATYLKVWFEDTVPNDLLNSIKESTGQYTEERQRIELEKVYTSLFENRKKEFTAMKEVINGVNELK